MVVIGNFIVYIWNGPIEAVGGRFYVCMAKKAGAPLIYQPVRQP